MSNPPLSPGEKHLTNPDASGQTQAPGPGPATAATNPEYAATIVVPAPAGTTPPLRPGLGLPISSLVNAEHREHLNGTYGESSTRTGATDGNRTTTTTSVTRTTPPLLRGTRPGTGSGSVSFDGRHVRGGSTFLHRSTAAEARERVAPSTRRHPYLNSVVSPSNSRYNIDQVVSPVNSHFNSNLNQTSRVANPRALTLNLARSQVPTQGVTSPHDNTARTPNSTRDTSVTPRHSPTALPANYDHHQAMREFSQARKANGYVSVDASPTFSGRHSVASSTSTMNASRAPGSHTAHLRRQQAASLWAGRYVASATRSTVGYTPSPTHSSFESAHDYRHGHGHSPSPTSPAFHHNASGYSQNSRHPDQNSQYKQYQFQCNRPGHSGSGGSLEESPHDRTSTAPLATGRTWATAPGSAPLPLPVPHGTGHQIALAGQRHTLSLGHTHANSFNRPESFEYGPTPAATPSTTTLSRTSSMSSTSDSHARTPSSSSPLLPTPADGKLLAAPQWTTVDPLLTPRHTLIMSPSLSRSPSPSPSTTPTQTPAPGFASNMSSEQFAAQLQAFAATVGLHVQVTPAPGSSVEPSTRPSMSMSPTPQSSASRSASRSVSPSKLSPPGTSAGKSSRRASFATLIPSGKRSTVPKRLRPGTWTTEKRLIFVDRVITAGYKSLSLCDLAEELGLKKKQLVNQLTPGRTGSIRELCMNAAARVLDPCSDCKKKMTNAKRKANAEGLADFLNSDPSTADEAGPSHLHGTPEEDDEIDCNACHEDDDEMEEDELDAEVDGEEKVKVAIKSEGEEETTDLEMAHNESHESSQSHDYRTLSRALAALSPPPPFNPQTSHNMNHKKNNPAWRETIDRNNVDNQIKK